MSRFEINRNTREPYVQEPRRMSEQSQATPAHATATASGTLDDQTARLPSPSPLPAGDDRRWSTCLTG
jgi:hypothetical protein